MRRIFKKLLSSRVSALFKKELNQIRRDRRLAMSLILPPVLQLTLFGFALSARVENVPLGVVDESKTKESRDLIAVLTESKSFQSAGYFFSVADLERAISSGSLNAGMVIPNDFARDLQRGRPTTVQFLLNATNANTAAISQGYAEAVIQNYNRQLRSEGVQPAFRRTISAGAAAGGVTSLHPAFLYNPGLKDSWFITTGVLGL